MKPSMQKWLIVLIPHVLISIMVICFSVFSLWIKLLLFLVIFISFIYYSRLHLFLHCKKSVVSIHQDSARKWLLSTNESTDKGDRLSADLLPSSFVSKMLVILNYKDSIGKVYTVIITPDCYSNNEFRRLRVRLNYFNTKNI